MEEMKAGLKVCLAREHGQSASWQTKGGAEKRGAQKLISMQEWYYYFVESMVVGVRYTFVIDMQQQQHQF